MTISSVHPFPVAPATILARVTLCLVWLAVSVGGAPAHDVQATEPAVGTYVAADAPQDGAPPAAPLAQSCQATVTVQNVNDSGPDSLRQALVDVCPGGVVNFLPDLAGLSVALSSTLWITQNLTVDGSGLTPPIQISGDNNGDGAPDVGVFYIDPSGSATLSHLEIVSGTASYGGGVYAFGRVTLISSTLSGNIANYGGGLANLAPATLISSTLSGNTATRGGGVYSLLGVTLINSLVFSNTATNAGGGLYNYDGTAAVTDSRFISNTAPGGAGGGLYNTGTLAVTQGTFSGNGAGWGGGLHNAGVATVVSSTFSSNSSANYGSGGGLENTGTLTLTQSSVLTNTGNGGFANNGTATVTGSLFSGNSDSGILNWGTATVVSSTIVSNAAEFFGGGLINAGTLTLTQSVVYSNTTIRTVGEGGGLFNQATATLIRSTVYSNTSDSGGGLTNRGTLSLSDSRVFSNTANHGGGLNNYGAATLLGSTVDGNTATWLGGGLSNGGTLTLTQSTVWGNRANDGGGLYTSNVSTTTVASSAILSNTAGNGGGLSSLGVLTVTQSTLSGNRAGSGGGLETLGPATWLIHATLTNNEATDGWGGGLDNASDGTVWLQNSVVAGNRAPNYPGQADCDSGHISLGYNVTGLNTGCVVTSTDVTTLDPLLAPLADNGGGTLTHALLPGSPALDLIPSGQSGCGTTYPQDQRGMRRPAPLGGACDAGALEYQRYPAYLPMVRR